MCRRSKGGSIRLGTPNKTDNSDKKSGVAQCKGMTQWCRDEKFYTDLDGRLSIRIYALPAYAVTGPNASAERQLEALDNIINSSMVSLVNLYQQSVGGYIDAEARTIIANEETLRDNRAWKWMFAARGLNEGETGEVRRVPEVAEDGTRKRTRKSLNAPTKMQPNLSLPGSSKYLLFEQVPVTSERDAIYDVPSEETLNTNAYFIAPWRLEQKERTTYGLIDNVLPGATPKGQGRQGVDFSTVNYHPTPAECGVAPLQSLKSWTQTGVDLGRKLGRGISSNVIDQVTESTPSGKIKASILKTAAHLIDDALPRSFGFVSDPPFRRVCTYKLVAGTPMHATPLTDGTWSDVRREEVMANVQKLADEQRGPFTAPPPNVLGTASAYDGLGAPTSSWYTTARFKAYMNGVNRKRKALGTEVDDYNYDGTDGYVTADIPKYEETAVSYPYEERMEDLLGALDLMVMFLVGPATDTWYIAPTKLAHLKPNIMENLNHNTRLRRKEHGHDMTSSFTRAHTEHAVEAPVFNSDAGQWVYYKEDEDWSSLFDFPYNAPFNPGQSPREKMLFLKEQVRMVPRCKLPHPGWLHVRTPYTLYNNLRTPQSSYKIGCGFSEHITYNINAASESLTRGFSDPSTMFDAHDANMTKFAKETTLDFRANFEQKNRHKREFVLVPAAKGIAACGEVSVSKDVWMIGTAPTLAATAARMTLQYVNSSPQTGDTLSQRPTSAATAARSQRPTSAATAARMTLQYVSSSPQTGDTLLRVSQTLGKGDYSQRHNDHVMWYGGPYNFAGQYKSAEGNIMKLVTILGLTTPPADDDTGGKPKPPRNDDTGDTRDRVRVRVKEEDPTPELGFTKTQIYEISAVLDPTENVIDACGFPAGTEDTNVDKSSILLLLEIVRDTNMHFPTLLNDIVIAYAGWTLADYINYFVLLLLNAGIKKKTYIRKAESF